MVQLRKLAAQESREGIPGSKIELEDGRIVGWP